MTPEEKRELLKNIGISTLGSVLANIITGYILIKYLDKYLKRG